MLKKLNWTAVCPGDRTECIEALKNAIGANGGAIMNFNLFSDVAMSCAIEVEEKDLTRLHSALAAICTLSGFDSGAYSSTSDREWMVLMNASFASGTGTLTQEIPDVPG